MSAPAYSVLVAMAGVAVVLMGILVARLHAVLALSAAALLVAALAPPGLAPGAVVASAATRVTEAFGVTAGKLGLLILFGAVIGEGLALSGAAARLARAAVGVAGPRRADLALASTAFVLSIPVFFDTIFLLLCPIARAVGRTTGRGRLLPILAVVAGGTMAHTLVPPTPGPLLIAQALGVDLRLMMVTGGVVGLLAVAAGLVFARALSSRMVLEEHDDPEHTLSNPRADVSARGGPPLSMALLPVVLPVAMIVAGGDRTLALAAGALLAMGLVAFFVDGGLEAARNAATTAISRAGVLVLVISAGGAFGAALRGADISGALAHVGAGGRGLLFLAFLLAGAMRTAQGSATVAMMTTAGIVAGLAHTALGYDTVWLALAVGCGAKNFAWMNDAGFLIISRTSGMTDAETLRSVSMMNVVMGVTAFVAVLGGSFLLPFPGR